MSYGCNFPPPTRPSKYVNKYTFPSVSRFQKKPLSSESIYSHKKPSVSWRHRVAKIIGKFCRGLRSLAPSYVIYHSLVVERESTPPSKDRKSLIFEFAPHHQIQKSDSFLSRIVAKCCFLLLPCCEL